MRITITNEQSFVVVDGKKIRNALHLLPGSKKKYNLSLVYVDNKEISKLNERYLQHKGPTDVLAFPLDSKQGEVIVSAETFPLESISISLPNNPVFKAVFVASPFLLRAYSVLFLVHFPPEKIQSIR